MQTSHRTRTSPLPVLQNIIHVSWRIEASVLYTPPFLATTAYKLEHRRHTVTHTLPHKCPHTNCKHAFAMRKDLDRHLATRKHRNAPGSGKPPKYYTCEVEGCKYHLEGFSRRDNLLRHTRKVHRSRVRSGVVVEDIDNGNRHRG